MQKVMNVYYTGPNSRNPHEEINELLAKGWKVIDMRPFSQIVSTSTGSIVGNKEGGYFGMTFVLEKE